MAPVNCLRIFLLRPVFAIRNNYPRLRPPIRIIWLALLMATATAASAAVLTGSFGSHDPSRMTNCEGAYYVYSTGGSMMSSTDRIHWSSGTSPFSSGVPTSVKNLIPSNQGIWAPDVIYATGRYLLYYAVADSSGTQSAIGLLTSPTLNPSDSTYHWTDAGVVIHHFDKQDLLTAIDPCPFFDASGALWMSYGSGYANGATWSDPTVVIMKLNDSTGLASSSNTSTYPVALGHIEASYVYYHNGYYYAFWNSGGCCSGTSSTYTVHMARSPTVTGTYVDENGATDSSNTLLAATVNKSSLIGNEYGPGQIGILNENGVYYCTYHYYPPSNGGAVLGEETIVWGTNGWPSVSADFVPGTYKITASGTNLSLGIRGASSANGTPVEEETYATSGYQQWNVAFTYSSGTTPDGYYSIHSVGSGNALDLYQSSAANGTLIEEWAAGTGNNQRWFIEETSDGKYRIISRTSGSVLSVPLPSQNPNLSVARINSGTDAQLTFPSQFGWNYNILTGTPSNWTTLTTLAGTGGTLTYTHTRGGINAANFWKLSIQEAVNEWSWQQSPGQEWTFSSP
jgi:arabinan endo-1,5-alpha-L-arabinosidase